MKSKYYLGFLLMIICAVGQGDIAVKFIDKCASCHSIGDPDSDLDGPDLTDALQYTDEELNDSFDSMEEEMEENINEDFRKELIAFFRSSDVIEKYKKALEASDESFAENLEPANTKIGEALYYGDLPFKNGGVSCVSCHDSFKDYAFAGGSLGPSLKKSATEMGKAPLFNGIKNSKYKVMRNIYSKKHKITDQEAFHLLAYLEKASESKEESYVSFLEILLAGGLATGLFILILDLVFKHRLNDYHWKKSVKGQ